VWRYLTEERRLPVSLLELVVRRDLVREGVRGTAWFLHCVGGRPSGWEMRGPSFKGFLAGGAKGAFVFSGSDAPSRVAVCEAAIDALSLAAIDGTYDDTAYVSTGGGWGDAGNAAIGQLLSKSRMVVAATDRGTGGDLLAGRLEDLARRYEISFERRRPAAKDWNEQLVGGCHGDPSCQDESAEGL
jgi:hypothetical protein